MSEFWKKTLVRVAIGFALGVLVGMIFLLFGIYHGSSAWNDLGRVAKHLMLSGIVGAINVGTTTIYSLERWGVLRCTLVHFCIVMATLCAVGFAMGWFSRRDPATLWVLAACVIAYFIIWLINYLVYKRQIRQINEALGPWKAKQRDE